MIMEIILNEIERIQNFLVMLIMFVPFIIGYALFTSNFSSREYKEKCSKNTKYKRANKVAFGREWNNPNKCKEDERASGIMKLLRNFLVTIVLLALVASNILPMLQVGSTMHGERDDTVLSCSQLLYDAQTIEEKRRVALTMSYGTRERIHDWSSNQIHQYVVWDNTLYCRYDLISFDEGE